MDSQNNMSKIFLKIYETKVLKNLNILYCILMQIDLITSTNSSEIKAITNIKRIISRANQSDPEEL
jgi:hypothetical protein